MVKLAGIVVLIAVAGLGLDWALSPATFYLREHRADCVGCRAEGKVFRTTPATKFSYFADQITETK